MSSGARSYNTTSVLPGLPGPHTMLWARGGDGAGRCVDGVFSCDFRFGEIESLVEGVLGAGVVKYMKTRASVTQNFSPAPSAPHKASKEL